MGGVGAKLLLYRKLSEGGEDQKTKHNLTSKKGRMRINTEIMLLKELLPECREVECNKASILHCTVQTLKRLQVTTTQLALTNAKLEKDNKVSKIENDSNPAI